MPYCTNCPIGYLCPGFGRVAPAICPAGFVCSKEGLHAPNVRCPAGFYCPNGTATVDPFRNDTTRRPYPCKPGTYCLTGVGYSDVIVGNFFYAQHCTEGFYCEAGSYSPRGSGLCPPGFICPLGTAVPKPTPQGSYSSLHGTIKSANCLPGYYAPTIETKECYPCPPGTSCEEEGTSVATICPPGTYRSTIEDAGIPCKACPEGTWSKNYGLRESGECIRCAPGVICPVEGMTKPCSRSDLPTPYEPVVNLNGVPVYEFLFSSTSKPGYFSYLNCLNLNNGYAEGLLDADSQKYFFGELLPPYIDELGRGPNFRATTQSAMKFNQNPNAKCYYNAQIYGSPLYQRLTEYLGPQYDIQVGHDHQGYSHIYSNGSTYYDGYFGQGSLYIDLPHARKFEPSFNCTRGFVMMNESEVKYDSEGQVSYVYTDSYHDPTGISRHIVRGVDAFYPGTCEADIICFFAIDNSSTADAQPCTEGYVCDEATTSTEDVYYPCRAGYVCGEGTTPDIDLRSPAGQFKRLCPPGYYCGDGYGLGQEYRNFCPVGYYCPTGTGDYLIGLFAGDAINRNLNATVANPYINLYHVRYMVKDDVRVISDHDKRCFGGIDTDLSLRYSVDWLGVDEEVVNPTLTYLRDNIPLHTPYTNDSFVTGHNTSYYRPQVVKESIASNLLCARDHKWRLINDTIYRKECNCTNFFYVTIAVYRLWKCTGAGQLDNLGIAAVNSSLHGGRDYWFDRWNFNETVCLFPEASNINTTAGALPYNPSLPSISYANNGTLNLTNGLSVQFTWTTVRNFSSYYHLKSAVEKEWNYEYPQRVYAAAQPLSVQFSKKLRQAMDPYIFDLKKAIEKVEEYGDRLQTLVWTEDEPDSFGVVRQTPGRLDMCECERATKCPNGTTSSAGAVSWRDCYAEDVEVIRRISVIPSWYNQSAGNIASHLANVSDFWELSGADASLTNGTETYKIGTVALNTFDTAVVTIDLTHITYNLTYGSDYRLAVYADCKPCPARYQCDYSVATPTCTNYPPFDMQNASFYDCLDRYRHTSCINFNGSYVDCSNATAFGDVIFQEPDLFKCMQIPFFCDEMTFTQGAWNIQYDGSYAAPAYVQERLTNGWSMGRGETVPGCCSCEPHWMPYFFRDTSIVDEGFMDKEHNFVQFSLLSVEDVQLTIVLELLHGQYIQEFDAFVPDMADIFVHTPTRAVNNQGNPSRATFVAIIQASQFGSSLANPMNLPLQFTRNSGQVYQSLGDSGTYSLTGLESQVLIGHTSDLYQSDPYYEERYHQHLIDEYVIARAQNETVNTSGYVNIPNLRRISQSLYSINNPVSDYLQPVTWWTNDFLALPYLPFFSNCKGSGNYLSISKVLETDPFCDLVSYANTVPVSPYPWESIYPNADKCNRTTTPDLIYRQIGNESVKWLDSYHGALFQCSFEEQISEITSTLRWYEQPALTTLFWFNYEPYEPVDYEPKGGTSWGQSDEIANNICTYCWQMIPVSVTLTDYGQQGVIPRQVRLSIDYYQVTKGRKRIVKAALEYLSEYQCYTASGGALAASLAAQGIPPCVLDVNGVVASTEYQLEIFFQPMYWFQLWNSFSFTAPIYFMFFVGTGVVAALTSIFLYIINRLFTRLKNPPPLRFFIMYDAISRPIIFGCCLGCAPITVAIMFIYSYFQDPIYGGSICSPAESIAITPNPMCFENIYDSQYIAVNNPEYMIILRTGRKMLALLFVGLYAIFFSATCIFPNWTKEDVKTDAQRLKNRYDPDIDFVAGDEDLTVLPDSIAQSSHIWRPHIWRRANYFLVVGIIIVCLIIEIEFSYSTFFSYYTYQMVVVFKVIFWAIENFFIEFAVQEKLADVCIMASVFCTGNMVTMGAASFVQFIISFVMQLLYNYTERLYVAPWAMKWKLYWPRTEIMLSRTFFPRKLTREQKAKEEIHWKEVCDEVAVDLESIEQMLDNLCDYAIDTVATVTSPLVYGVLGLFYVESQIAYLYAIATVNMVYFISFAVVIIPFVFITDVFTWHMHELIHGWKVYDYLLYQVTSRDTLNDGSN